MSAARGRSPFAQGQTFEQFVARTAAQRDLWLANAAHADIAPPQTARLVRVRRDLRILIVAEDWVQTRFTPVPYVASLAREAQVLCGIIDRSRGAPVMARHLSADGRPVTPTIVLLRAGRDAGAWVERPAPLQEMFVRMATDPESARQFAARSRVRGDRGRTAIRGARHAGRSNRLFDSCPCGAVVRLKAGHYRLDTTERTRPNGHDRMDATERTAACAAPRYRWR